MFNNFLRSLAIVAAPVLLSASIAEAKTVIFDVGGGDNGTAFGPGVIQSGAASQFNVSADLTGVTYTAPIACFGVCEAIFEISSEIGPSSSALSLVARTDLTSSNSGLLFENLSLGAGTYYGVLYVIQGFATWAANDTQGGVGTGPVADGSDFLITLANVGTPFRSTFEQTDLSYQYTLSQPAPVPLPASAWLLAVGLFALLRIGRNSQK